MVRKGIALFFILSLMLIGGCKAPKAAGTPDNGKPVVYTSFYTLYDFTAKIGGKKINLVNLVPPGTEPHDWEPSPKTMAGLQQSDLFIYNGAGFEPWVDKFLAASGVDLKSLEATREVAMYGPDPHVWLDPNLAERQAFNIKNALIDIDPANKNYYEANYQTFAAKLKALDQEYKEALSQAQTKEIVVAHNAFGYLARRYGLKEIPIMGLSPEAEPSPADLARITNQLREKKIGYIFFEELSSPKVAKVLAQEVGAKTLVLNPVEGLTASEAKAGKDYLGLMQDNLANLKTALGVK